MCFHRRSADCQPQAHAAGLGRVEGVESLLGVGEAGAGIENTDADSLLDRPGIEQDAALAISEIIHCLDRIVEKVDEHLLKEHAVALHDRSTGSQIELHHDLVGVGVVADQAGRLAGRGVDRHGQSIRLGPAEQLAHALDDVACMFGAP